MRGKWSVLAHAGWVCWFGGLVVGDRALLALGDDKNFSFYLLVFLVIF